MDGTFMGAEARENRGLSWWRYRYRSVLAVLLLPSLLLIGVFSYYPAVFVYQWPQGSSEAAAVRANSRLR
jgi:hypothetical protein